MLHLVILPSITLYHHLLRSLIFWPGKWAEGQWWVPSSSSIVVTDLAGEVMVNSQAQSLFLQSNECRWTLLTARNFPLSPPKAGSPWHRPPADSPRAERHPDAGSYGSREWYVGRDSVSSLPHIPLRVTPGPPGTLRSRAPFGLAVCAFSCRKADGLTVMLQFWALRNKSLLGGCMWAPAVGN